MEPDKVRTEDMTYPSRSGGVEAYLAQPTGEAPVPALVVIQEVFGLADHMRDVARRFAGAGYLALVPDLYCHDKQRLGLSQDDLDQAMAIRRRPDLDTVIAGLESPRREAVSRALDWLANRDASGYLADLQDAVAYLRGRPDVQPGAIGCVGYCMGGGLSGRLATSGAELAAAVIYYGGIPPLEEVPNVRCPVQGHYGGEDPNITSHVPELEAAMKTHGKEFTAYVYPSAQHAFFNDQIPNHHPEASALAWQRTLDFLGRHLKVSAPSSRS